VSIIIGGTLIASIPAFNDIKVLGFMRRLVEHYIIPFGLGMTWMTCLQGMAVGTTELVACLIVHRIGMNTKD
jgi:hypothetical protein